MSVVERVCEIVLPLLAERDVALYDIEYSGGGLRILVETQDLEVIEKLTRAISAALDEADPIEAAYTLEVSSPGLERTLRTPAHFVGAVGSTVNVKTVPGTEGERRFTGVLVAADRDTVVVRDSDTLAERTVALDAIERARTIFEWGPPPKPGHSRPKSNVEQKAKI